MEIIYNHLDVPGEHTLGVFQAQLSPQPDPRAATFLVLRVVESQPIPGITHHELRSLEAPLLQTVVSHPPEGVFISDAQAMERFHTFVQAAPAPRIACYYSPDSRPFGQVPTLAEFLGVDPSRY